MKKTRILLSSVLKPVNDTRMFEKIGASLTKLPQAEVHIAGFPGKLPTTSLPIIFHPFTYFKRLSWGRVNVQRQYWQLLRQLRPEVMLVSSHELLLTSLLFKLFYGGKIWYDVRENYFLNLTTQNNYSKIAKYLLAYTVRLLERVTAPFIQHFLLAEKSYATELPFIDHKFTVLENKFKRLSPDTLPEKNYPIQLNPDQVKLLYSGSISEMYGVFEAIELCRQLHQEHSGISLTIIGYCAIPKTLAQIKAIIRDKPYIRLIGGDQLVSHGDIVRQIEKSDVGLLPYQPHPSTFNCTPTKLFEYLANALPVLVQENPYWAKRVNHYQAGIMINFRQFNAKELIYKMKNSCFYLHGIPTETLWETEEKRLLELFINYF